MDKKIPTITELILMNVFNQGETVWTSDLRMILGESYTKTGGKISAMIRRGFIRGLFQEDGDTCWEILGFK